MRSTQWCTCRTTEFQGFRITPEFVRSQLCDRAHRRLPVPSCCIYTHRAPAETNTALGCPGNSVGPTPLFAVAAIASGLVRRDLPGSVPVSAGRSRGPHLLRIDLLRLLDGLLEADPGVDDAVLLDVWLSPWLDDDAVPSVLTDRGLRARSAVCGPHNSSRSASGSSQADWPGVLASSSVASTTNHPVCLSRLFPCCVSCHRVQIRL